ncbi:MAG: hypothetical protein ACMXYK_01950, partial [Candidatus Woesearchaeota archaeon]
METLTSRIFGEYVDSATPHADTLKRAAEIYENTFKQIRDDEAFDTIRRIPHTTPWYGLQRTAHLEALKSAAKYIKTHTTPQVGQPSKKRTFSTDTPMHLKEGLLDFIKYASSSDPHTTYSGLLDHIDQEITKNRKQQRKKEKGNLYETIDAQTPKDFETVTIDQIVGNSEAKIGIERQIKALSLYDPQLKKNPAYETGIMS